MNEGISNEIIDLLRQYDLQDPDSFSDRILRLSDENLRAFLDDYHSIYVTDQGIRIGGPASGLALWPDHVTTTDWIEKLRVWSLWVDHAFVEDPVLPLTGPSTLGLGQERPLVDRVTTALGRLHDLIPLASIGYVSLTGVPAVRQPPAEIPLTIDPANDAFDPALRAIAERRLRIAAAIRPAPGETGVAIVPPDEDYRRLAEGAQSSDMISIRFDDDADFRGEFYMYGEAVALDDSDGSLTIHYPMSGEPLADEQFLPWVNQSVTKVLRHRLRDLEQELLWTQALGADFVTSSCTNMEFVTAYGRSGDAPRETQVITDIQLPGVTNLGPHQIARLRANSEALLRFRQVLRDVIAVVRSNPGDPEYSPQVTEARRYLREQMVIMERDVKRERILQAGTLLVIVPVATVIGALTGGVAAAAVAGAATIGSGGATLLLQRVAGPKNSLGIYTELRRHER